MNNDITLEQIIRQNIYLPPVPNTKGWYPCVHIGGCDRGHKGPRAAFNFFNNSGVAFHCFNCSLSTVYDPEIHKTIPKKMKQILSDFGISEQEWEQIEFNNLGKNVKKQTGNNENFKSIEPDGLNFPEPFYYLSNASEKDKWALIAKAYLQERNISPNEYPFMLCSTKANDHLYKKWKGRLIIPIFKDNKLIFWQGRSLGERLKKYESPSVPKEKVIFGFDKLFNNLDKPLYVVEGWFDAYPINGVAILGNDFTPEQIKWLNKSPRKKVYIPDHERNGKQNAFRALENGWSVSLPDIGNEKDISSSVKKYGKLYVLSEINKKIYEGSTARMLIPMYCR